ncbi:hypothetical protein Goari_020575 [Gossypium aridum]|uniref:Uncharacterized protein n=1 Tax=Gossypium aridum TaxID=34290 RepID=A0A7J8YM62_GOSAI|nr:hypothetical protein [Gossypium aridum]
MLLTVEESVGKLEVSIEDVNKSLDGVEDRIDNWKEQSRDYVKMSFDSTMDKVNELFISHKDKLSKRNDALEAMVMALKEETMATTMALSTRIKELEVELALCQATVGERVSSAALTNKDVLKPKEFVGTRDKTTDKRQGVIKTWQKFQMGEYVREFNELMLRVSESEAMTVAASMVKLGLGKDKLRSSKSEERGVCEKDHKEDNDGNGIDDNDGNGKPRVGKNKPNRKRDKLKCFLCNSPHILKKCLKKSALKKKLVGKALVLGFFTQVVVKGYATSELGESLKGLPPKEEVSLSSILREKVAMKTVKLGPMRLNSSEASELAESSTRLPPMGEVGGPSDFKQKEVMQVGQLTRVNVTNKMVQVKKQLATRALREWVRENVTGRSSKPVTIVPNAFDRGLLCRWGSFGQQELA